MLKFAFRNIFRQKGRMLLTLTVIVFGVTGLILSGGFVQDIFIQLRDATIHSRLGHLQIYAKGYYEYGRRAPYDYMIPQPEALGSQIEAWPGVESVMQRVSFSGLLNNGRTDVPVIGEGIEPDKEAAISSFFFVIEGQGLSAGDPDGLLLGEGVARSLNAAPGDYVTLLVNTPEGGLNTLDLRVTGIFRTFSKDFDDRAIRIPLASARSLLLTEDAHSLVISLEETERTDHFAALLRQALEGKGYEVFTWLELDDFYSKTVALYDRQFGVLQLIILLIVLLSVMNSVGMTINERIGELGTLRALGQRSRDLFRLLLIENTFLGLAGASVGVLVGVGLAYGISSIGIPMPPPPNANTGYTAYIRIVPGVVASAFVIGFLATVLSAVLAARRPTKVAIVDALRQNV